MTFPDPPCSTLWYIPYRFVSVTAKSTSKVTYGTLRDLNWVCVGDLAFVILFLQDINYDNKKNREKEDNLSLLFHRWLPVVGVSSCIQGT